MGDTEKNLMILQYCDVISWLRYVDMDNNKDHEKIVKEILKTSDSIRKKYRALKTGKIEEDIILKKPIIDPLKQIVENTVEYSERFYYDWNILFGRRRGTKRKRPSALNDNPIQTSTPVKSMLIQSKTISSTLNEVSEIIRPHCLSYDHAPTVEEIFEISDESLVTSIRNQFQTSEGQEKLYANYSSLEQKYLKAVSCVILSGKKVVNINVVYGFQRQGNSVW